LPHWDKQKEQAGETALRTDLLFKTLSDTPIISLSYLQDKYPHYSWTPQGSGISIPKDIAEELFSLIQENTKVGFEPPTRNEIKLYLEGKLRKTANQSYDRNPNARQACIDHLVMIAPYVDLILKKLTALSELNTSKFII